METMARKPRKLPGKYNWPMVFADLDSGLPWRQVAEKFSIPERVMYEKMRHRKKTLAIEVREVALPDKGKPAPLEKPQTRGPKPQNFAISLQSEAISAELSDSELLTFLESPESVLSVTPADLQSLLARRAGILVAQGFASVRAPESVKELVPLAKLYRDLAGLSKDTAKGGHGLLSPPRAFGRRAVGTTMDAVVVESVREPVGGWPDGM